MQMAKQQGRGIEMQQQTGKRAGTTAHFTHHIRLHYRQGKRSLLKLEQQHLAKIKRAAQTLNVLKKKKQIPTYRRRV